MKFRLIIMSLAAMFIATACHKESVEDSDLEVTLVVKGAAFNDSKPVLGVMIVLNTYKSTDIAKTTPIKSDTTYTQSSGLFQVETKASFLNAYDVKAYDIDGLNNGGRFKASPERVDLSVDKTSPAYDEPTKSYIIDGCIFSMVSAE